MKFSTLLRSLLVTVLAIPMAGQAHYFRATQFANAGAQEILTWGDFHKSTTPENKDAIIKQTQDMIAYAKALNAAIIVEDSALLREGQEMNTQASQEPPVLSREDLNTITFATPISGLASHCHYNNIECTNVEFRFNTHRPLNVYFKVLENKKKNLLSCDDPVAFTDYYKKKFAQLEQLVEIPCKEFFARAAKSSLTIEKFCDQNDLPIIPNIDEIIKKVYYNDNLVLDKMRYADKLHSLFSGYTCAFLDLEILHAIAKYKDHKIIFICAGDFHIECVERALMEIGYATQHNFGQICHDNGISYIEPTAIDVQQVLDGLQQVPAYPTTKFITVICLVLVIMGCAIAIRTLKPILL